jgi:transcriptional regulator with XRE-family HTH domain
MSPNHMVRNRRIELGLEESEVASAAGFSPEEYGDIELHQSELTSTIALFRVKRLCEVLGLTITSLFELPTSAASGDEVRLGRKSLADLRRERGWPVQQLADELGMEEWVVEKIEADESAVDQWPFDLAARYAEQMGLPVTRLTNTGEKQVKR